MDSLSKLKQDKENQEAAFAATFQVEAEIAENEAKFKSTSLDPEVFYGRSDLHDYDPLIDAWLDCFDEFLEYNEIFALYRLPHSQSIHLILATPDNLKSFDGWSDFSTQQGFTLIPFEIGRPRFPFTIRPQKHYVGLKASLDGLKQWMQQRAQFMQQRRLQCEKSNDPNATNSSEFLNTLKWAATSLQQQRGRYHLRFAKMQEALQSGQCSKLVLAREAGYHYATYSIAECFFHACELHPNTMVYLATDEQRHLWFGATPELFVSGQQYHKLKSTRSTTTPAANTLAANIDTPSSSEAAASVSPASKALNSAASNSVAFSTETNPDILGQVDDTQHFAWKTMSLAGTMPVEQENPPRLEEWSDKNRHEQAIVTQFISKTLKPWCSELNLDGPTPTRAGNISHLKTDVTFKLKHESDLGKVLEGLHPTPAVCGMPKDLAYEIIRNCEGQHREYYGGTVGLVNLAPSFIEDATPDLFEAATTGETEQHLSKTESAASLTDSVILEGPASQGQVVHTKLFVNLRCMQFVSSSFAICYAGGGILPESDETSEFIETQRKLETMRNLIEHPKYGAGSYRS